MGTNRKAVVFCVEIGYLKEGCALNLKTRTVKVGLPSQEKGDKEKGRGKTTGICTKSNEKYLPRAGTARPPISPPPSPHPPSWASTLSPPRFLPPPPLGTPGESFSRRSPSSGRPGSRAWLARPRKAVWRKGPSTSFSSAVARPGTERRGASHRSAMVGILYRV